MQLRVIYLWQPEIDLNDFRSEYTLVGATRLTYHRIFSTWSCRIFDVISARARARGQIKTLLNRDSQGLLYTPRI